MCVLMGDHIRRLIIFAVVTHVILRPIWLFFKPVLAVSFYFVSIDTDLFDLLLYYNWCRDYGPVE